MNNPEKQGYTSHTSCPLNFCVNNIDRVWKRVWVGGGSIIVGVKVTILLYWGGREAVSVCYCVSVDWATGTLSPGLDFTQLSPVRQLTSSFSAQVMWMNLKMLPQQPIRGDHFNPPPMRGENLSAWLSCWTGDTDGGGEELATDCAREEVVDNYWQNTVTTRHWAHFLQEAPAFTRSCQPVHATISRPWSVGVKPGWDSSVSVRLLSKPRQNTELDWEADAAHCWFKLPHSLTAQSARDPLSGHMMVTSASWAQEINCCKVQAVNLINWCNLLNLWFLHPR